jgi:prolipoprotein diacylglyceryl transferase
MAIVVALGAFFIRMGNLMNSEIIGKPTYVPWAFIFKRVDEIPRHPSQLYEGLSYLLIFFILIKVYLNRKEKSAEGLLSGLFLIGVFSVRFIIEFFKEVQVPFERHLPLDMGQLLSIPLIMLGIIIFIRSRKQAKDESQKV